jgi:hypothetical protein
MTTGPSSGHRRGRAAGRPAGSSGSPGRRAEVPPAELARARRAYAGSLDAARAWRAFSPDPKHHDTTYWALLTSLFAEPGMNRTRLVDRVIDAAGVSRSTAERAVRDARASGLVDAEPAGAEVLLDLSDRMFDHCLGYFRDWMDAPKLNRALGYAGDADQGG